MVHVTKTGTRIHVIFCMLVERWGGHGKMQVICANQEHFSGKFSSQDSEVTNTWKYASQICIQSASNLQQIVLIRSAPKAQPCRELHLSSTPGHPCAATAQQPSIGHQTHKTYPGKSSLIHASRL
jgi:hypothetical protein